MLQFGPRDAQHGEALVERDDPLGGAGEYLRHPARPGPDIEQATERIIVQRRGQRMFDLLVRTVKAADLVPILGMIGEIGRRLFLARGTDLRELASVLLARRAEIAILALAGLKQLFDPFADRVGRIAPVTRA